MECTFFFLSVLFLRKLGVDESQIGIEYTSGKSFALVFDVSHEKNPLSFCYTGWIIGILVMVYYNPYITGEYNPLYNPTNQGFFIAHVVSSGQTS